MALAVGDDDERTDHADDAGAASGAADMANPDVGGVGAAVVITTNPEQTPNKALYPTGAGGIVSAGG